MSNDTFLLITSSYDHTLTYWDVINRSAEHAINYPENVFLFILKKEIINKLAISEDRKYLGAAASFSAKIYDVVSQYQKPVEISLSRLLNTQISMQM